MSHAGPDHLGRLSPRQEEGRAERTAVVTGGRLPGGRGAGHSRFLEEAVCRSQQLAQNTGILAVVTVVGIPADMRAEQKGAFVPTALDIVQEDRASAWAKVGFSRGC